MTTETDAGVRLAVANTMHRKYSSNFRRWHRLGSVSFVLASGLYSRGGVSHVDHNMFLCSGREMHMSEARPSFEQVLGLYRDARRHRGPGRDEWTPQSALALRFPVDAQARIWLLTVEYHAHNSRLGL